MPSMKLRFFTWLLLATTWAIPARTASAAVSDAAHVFGADAIAQADAIDRDIRQRHGLDFNVETFPAIPADAQPNLEAKGKPRFFEEWADQRAIETGTAGVYTLICMKPGHIQTVVGNRTRQKAFTLSDRAQLEPILIDAFKAKEYDRGLTQAAQFVRDRVDANLGARAGTGSAPGGTPTYGGGAPTYGGGKSTTFGTGGGFTIFGWLCLIVGVLAIFAIIRGLINRPKMYGGGGYPPPTGYQGGAYPGGYSPGYGGGGGGGFGRGLMGGLLGGVLGSAGYDWLSGRDRGAGGGGQSTPPGGGYDPQTGAQLPDADTSFSGGGSDFDNSGSSGGSDFGGGGSDSGGGADFGGGGGDSGSSGGGDF